MTNHEQDNVEYYEWLDEGEDYGFPVGFLCISCMWDVPGTYCKACADTCREPVPFSEVWGAFDE